MNYSFWADEAYVSGIAEQLATGKFNMLQAFNGISYQKLYVLVLASFFKIFGVSEFTARLPSMLAYVAGVFIIFFLARRLSNKFGGFLASFLYAFSHLNLAYATQAKPYIIIEAIVLLVIYLLTDKKKISHVLIIILCSIATLLHSIGVLIWVIYFVYNVLTWKRGNVLTFITFLLISYVFILPIIRTSLGGGQLLPYNHLYQIIKLFAYKYSFISISAFFGYVWIFRKYRTLSIAILVYSTVVLFMAGFRVYIFNIRYVLSLFGIIFLFFGIFWAKVGERYGKSRSFIPIIVIIILYTTGYKIVRLPQAYYNPNIDKYGDVQIANYKDFYSQLKKRFPEYKKMYVLNDTFDVEYWYFGRYSNAYFMKSTIKPYKHHTADAMIYGSLEDFKKIMKDQPQGLLVMEDWESFLPEDIKQFAKKNLKLEFRVESLKEAPNDPWPLALYSWGMK